MNFREAVAARVMYFLRLHCMSKYKLAKEAILDQSTVKNIFKPKTKSVDLKTIYSICQVFGLTLSEFFDDPVFVDLDF